jgi:hypothetical protein
MVLRFGNEAFVTWYDKMVSDLPSVMQHTLLPQPESADESEKQRHAQMIGNPTLFLSAFPIALFITSSWRGGA